MAEFNMSDEFSVSLDSLDQILIRQYIDEPRHGPDNMERVMWANSYTDGTTTYCHAGLPPNLLDQDCCFEPAETYICHICSVEVPKIYSQLHVESRMHNIHKKLSKVVLDNLSRQININIIDSVGSDEQSGRYYCDICSKVVSDENKQNHEKSYYHLHSRDYQNLADNFVQFYIESTEDLLDTDIYQSSESDSEIDNFMSYTSSGLSYSDKPSLDLISRENVLDTSEQIAAFQQYLKEMIVKYNYNTYKLPITEDNSIVIVTPMGLKKKITRKQFHSFIDIGSCRFCQICATWIEIDSDHIRTQRHVWNIVRPVNDNFIRKFILNDSSHCIYCNSMVSDEYKHVNLYHKKYNGADTETMEVPINSAITTKTTYSEVCKKHINGKDLANNSENNKLNNLNPNIDTSTSVIRENKKKTKKAIKNLYCDLCNVKIITNDMELHKRGKMHRRMVLDMDKMSSEPNNSAEHQDTVNTSGTSSEFTNEEKLLLYMKQMTPFNDNELRCLVCDVRVPNSNSDIIEHVEGINHNKFMNALLLITKIVKISIKSFYCKLCKYHIEDFIDHIIQNVNHKIKFEVVFRTELSEYAYNDPSTSDPSAYEYRYVYEDILKRNKTVRNDDSFSYCNVCSITLMRMNEIDHFLSGWHKSSLTSHNITSS